MNTATEQNNQQNDDKSSSLENSDSSSDEPPGGGLKTKTKEDSHYWSIILEGEWREVTDACSDFTDKLEEAHPYKDPEDDRRLKEWIKWHPRKDDDGEELLKRTASQAKFEPDQPPARHLKKLRTHFFSFCREISEHNGLSAGLSKLRKASKKGAKALFSFLGFSIGKIEEFFYKKVILRTNPFYFDNSLISASFKKINRFEVNENDRYKLKAKIHDEEVQDTLQSPAQQED